MKILRALFTLSISFVSFSVFSLDNSKYISIEELANSGRIATDLESPGGQTSLDIEITVQNLAGDSTHIWLEAGRRLESVDPTEQDVFVVRNQMVSLAAGEIATIVADGFCCQAKKGGPKKKSKFRIGTMAAAAWVFLANIIDKNNFPKKSIQQAVWCMSNGHDIRTIPVVRGRPTIRLRQTVADLLDVSLPWYSFGYAIDTTQLFSGKKDAIVAEVLYEVPKRALISGQIRNSNGELVFQSPSHHARRGENIYFLDADIKGWPDGEYVFYLMEDFHTTNQQKTFTIDKFADASQENVLPNMYIEH